LLHLLKLLRRGRTIFVADDDTTHLRRAHVVDNVHRNTLFFEQAEVFTERSPLVSGGGFRGIPHTITPRRYRAPFAGHQSGDALPQLTLRACAVYQRRNAGRAHHVDKTRRDHLVVNLDHPFGFAMIKFSDYRYPAITDTDVGAIPWIPLPIDDVPARDDQVEFLAPQSGSSKRQKACQLKAAVTHNTQNSNRNPSWIRRAAQKSPCPGLPGWRVITPKFAALSRLRPGLLNSG